MSPKARLFKTRKQLLVRKPTFKVRYFFTLIATNGEPIAQSEAYNSKQSALDVLRVYFPEFTVDDQTGE
jgi:hypothetical protein